MLNIIIDTINTRIGGLNLFDRIYGLCSKITRDKKTFPAEYCNGEYKQVSDFDLHKGIIYHRQTGEISLEEIEDEQIAANDPFYQRTYPMRVVAVIRKDLLGIDNDAYSESRVAQDFLSVIARTTNKALREELKVDSVIFEVESIGTDREDIFKEEYSGFDNSFFKYEYLYIAIDYNILVSGSLSCLTIICESDYDISETRDYSEDYS
jgi:hypothetical protein